MYEIVSKEPGIVKYQDMPNRDDFLVGAAKVVDTKVGRMEDCALICTTTPNCERFYANINDCVMVHITENSEPNAL